MEIDDAVDRGVKLLLFDGHRVAVEKIQPGQAQLFGEEAFAVYEAPEELLLC